jgi:hypothetical protein
MVKHETRQDSSETTPFDAKSVARGIEEEGKLMIDRVGNAFTEQRLSETLRGLKKDEIDQVEAQLKRDQWIPNALPSGELERGKDGTLAGITFTKSRWDRTPDALATWKMDLSKPVDPPNLDDTTGDKPWTYDPF